ncbi:hypothetical protein NIES4072_65530 [Nostoc commune NIES-4072]|uniref:DUF3859 domain-containing protein n=1 Tax=Nostoc commune NIES-4072 TaxID=2005467 RepID=A0A2R5G458_NOSCO|nr:DUF3859 domain-containing protein [Nostoc commune]BBD70187.1 hypothetical protein NIES4070_65980 [Nostoc commune HK-02]GBG22841.1 hypothetical protein NIES4072_65530 [Nostoc commune NIES-4072]
MNQRLTTEQLTQIVAEVGNLQTRKEAEIEPEQVKQILQELGLPPDLLDEALVQVQRRQVLKVQEKRNRTIAIGVIAAIAIVIMGTLFSIQQHNSTLERVSTQRNRITLTQDDGSDLRNISRQNSPEVFYRVTLKDAPIGQKLDLTCNWINPNGEIVKQNRYQTREIDKSIWDTQCRYIIGSASTPGKWKAQIFLQGRQLSETEFEVK